MVHFINDPKIFVTNTDPNKSFIKLKNTLITDSPRVGRKSQIQTQLLQ
jgi:hypothetical protein